MFKEKFTPINQTLKKKKSPSHRRNFVLVPPISNGLIILKYKHMQSKHKITFAAFTCAQIHLVPHKISSLSSAYSLSAFCPCSVSKTNKVVKQQTGIILDWFWCVCDISSAVFVFSVTVRDRLCYSFRTVSACVHQAPRSITELREKCVRVCVNILRQNKTKCLEPYWKLMWMFHW